MNEAVEAPESVPEIGVDISSESYREYTFANGATVTVHNPLRLVTKRQEGGDSHRIIAKGGRGHYIPVGWLMISWETKAGYPVLVA
jgi:hypothetical protein